MTQSNWLIDSKKKHDADEFLRVKPGCNLKIRLIGQPVKTMRVFTKNRKCIPIDDESIGIHLKAKYPDVCDNLSVRYACWCIDREDNSLRILDMPISIARTFGNRVKLVGGVISGAEGCDWKITTNGRKGKDVRYEAVFIEETPLTEEEIQMVKDRKAEEGKNFDLTEIFKSYDYAKAEGKLLESA